MKRIGLISDTHGFLDEQVFTHFKECNEIWHAGDFGGSEISARLNDWSKDHDKVFKGVYGNIDEMEVRHEFPEQLVFMVEEIKVMIRHIGGSPPNYNPQTRKELELHRPALFVTGHSHILKVIFDERRQCLHINPGAAGKQGWHQVRTLVRLQIDGKEMKNCEVIELGKR